MVTGWFDAGHASEALVGDGRFFVRSPAVDIHDRIFIVQQLGAWARARDDRALIASEAVVAAVAQLLASGRPDDAVDLLLSFSLAAGDNRDLPPLDPTVVAEQLRDAELQYRESGTLDARRLEAIRTVRAQLVGTDG